ncbi:RNA polymerase ii mediator complex component [Apiospora phragmitis]|uniref:RNA polymerase ii mediator complex component n=1 Tax=Apiospora phragmitis TaxID=2905665 RepID=A0ABR1WAV0_9PEZI
MIVANIPASTGEPEVNWILAQHSFVPEMIVPEEFLLDLPINVMVDQMLNFVDLMKKWLKDWVTDGHSPLHHRLLYHTKMPRCVQDAYSTMSLYFLARGPSNQDSIFQLIDDRVTQLFQTRWARNYCQTTSLPFGRLSRVQAMVAYQIIRLFDGDIRMRAHAEADDMWAQTRRSASPISGGDASTSPLNQSIPFDGIVSLDESVVTWKLWILTESIRRTWLASNLIMELYHYIKQGWSQCPGSIPFTLRAGLWEAETAYAWFAAQRNHEDALFVPIFKQPAMMQATSPRQVDEFGHALLGITWGLERMARWHDRMGETLDSPLTERAPVVSN